VSPVRSRRQGERMTASGPKRTWCRRLPMSGFEGKADQRRTADDVYK